MPDERPAVGGETLARLIRDHLHEMTAAAQSLEPLLPDNGKARNYLGVLNRGLCRQQRLARRLELDARFRSEDEVRLFPEPVELAELCRGLMERVDGTVRTLNMRAEFSAPVPALVTVADRDAVEEMLLVLVAEAVRGAAPGDVIALELDPREGMARFILKVTGSGVPADPPVGPREDDGDLGLFLAGRIARLHGGRLLSSDGEHKGTRFVASIPLRDRATGGLLCSPYQPYQMESGGWDRVLVALSDCLPVECYLPEELD